VFLLVDEARHQKLRLCEIQWVDFAHDRFLPGDTFTVSPREYPSR
jgi:hypothetical protein